MGTRIVITPLYLKIDLGGNTFGLSPGEANFAASDVGIQTSVSSSITLSTPAGLPKSRLQSNLFISVDGSQVVSSCIGSSDLTFEMLSAVSAGGNVLSLRGDLRRVGVDIGSFGGDDA